MTCTGCEILPQLPLGSGTFYVAAPLAHTHKTLRDLGLPATEPTSDVIGFVVAAQALPDCLAKLAAALSAPEIEGARAVFVPAGGEFGLSQLMNTQPLRAFIGRMQAAALIEMIDSNRLLCHFQPLVLAATPNVVFAYECLLRGRAPDGSLVYPDKLFGLARSAEMLFHLDRSARLTALKQQEEFGIDLPIFINFNPTAIYDPAYCLRTTIAAAEKSKRDPGSFVFEVIESDSMSDVGHLLRILDKYRSAGFRVALDDLGAGFGSLNLLSSLRPDFVKFDRELVRNVYQDPYKGSVLGKLLEMSRDLGVQTVAEGVETYEEWEWVRDRGVDYVQGYFFARPASPPPLPRPLESAA